MRTSWAELVAILVLHLLVVGGGGALAAGRPVDAAEQEATRLAIGGQLGRGRSVALVIGVSEFDSRSWPRLAGIGPEIEKVRAAFAAQGFVLDGNYPGGRMTVRQMREAIAGFLRRHGGSAENRLVIYVATHGHRDMRDPEGYGYLVASDSGDPFREGFEDTAYSVKELSRDLAGIAAQHVFLFFNACFSGAMMPDPVRSGAGDAQRPAQALSKEVAEWTLSLLSRNARLVLTAGSDSQVVPDVDNPYAASLVEGLAGAADADRDGLILGTELAQYVRGRVARETRLKGRPNDAVFAVLPKLIPPPERRPDAPPGIDYALQGDFVFLSPLGPGPAASAGISESEEILRARLSRLPGRQFTECADCPVMVEMPKTVGPDGRERRIAMARTETTYAEWDACYRELGCGRHLPDEGRGRGDRPAGGITWQDALEFEAWLDRKRRSRCAHYRLPTPSEWLAAAGFAAPDAVASGPSPAAAPRGVAEQGRAVCWGCGRGADGAAAARTASLPANPLGLHDMEGNLWEWVREEGDGCGFSSLRMSGRCAVPGLVMGGSYATRADRLDEAVAGGRLPRTSNLQPFSLPTVGLRLACELD